MEKLGYQEWFDKYIKPIRAELISELSQDSKINPQETLKSIARKEYSDYLKGYPDENPTEH